ncbi:MAG: hypothetical protein HY548_02655 [Elusimicrobia bacterium]|nr:hypothetical protein [Elusimicrobiota bacterium]
MNPYEEYFKDIDFDRDWDESDWERFFEAQEKLSKEVRKNVRRMRTRLDDESQLSFRNVLQRFGINPDHPESAPFEPSSSDEPPEEETGAPSRLAFWEEGAEAESLPVYRQSKCYAYRIVSLCENDFGPLLHRKYKSRSHRQLQVLLKDLRAHALQVPRHLAAGHDLGYRVDSIKGNIVRCKMALIHADACLGLVTRFPRRRLSPEGYLHLVRETARMRNSLMVWIAHLRQRFVPSGY